MSNSIKLESFFSAQMKSFICEPDLNSEPLPGLVEKKQEASELAVQTPPPTNKVKSLERLDEVTKPRAAPLPQPTLTAIKPPQQRDTLAKLPKQPDKVAKPGAGPLRQPTVSTRKTPQQRDTLVNVQPVTRLQHSPVSATLFRAPTGPAYHRQGSCSVLTPPPPMMAYGHDHLHAQAGLLSLPPCLGRPGFSNVVRRQENNFVCQPEPAKGITLSRHPSSTCADFMHPRAGVLAAPLNYMAPTRFANKRPVVQETVGVHGPLPTLLTASWARFGGGTQGSVFPQKSAPLLAQYAPCHPSRWAPAIQTPSTLQHPQGGDPMLFAASKVPRNVQLIRSVPRVAM